MKLALVTEYQSRTVPTFIHAALDTFYKWNLDKDFVEKSERSAFVSTAEQWTMVWSSAIVASL